jgi:hypothetical protein
MAKAGIVRWIVETVVSARRIRKGIAPLQLFVMSLLLTSHAWAQQPPPEISVSPNNPSASDVLKIRVDTHAFCYPDAAGDYVATVVAGSTIRITARLTCVTFDPPPPPFVITQFVGPLPAGAYRVEYWAFTGSGTPQRYATAALSVSDARSIPTMSGYALLILVIALPLVALFLRRGTKGVLHYAWLAALLFVSMLQMSSTLAAEPAATEASDLSVGRSPYIDERILFLLFYDD